MNSNLVSTALLSNNHNPMNDCEVVHSPDDAVTCMSFSPASIAQANYLIAGSLDNNVSCWEIQSTGNSIPKMKQSMTAPVLDVAWSNVIHLFSLLYIITNYNLKVFSILCQDGSKVFMAGWDQMAKCWDLNSNQCTQVINKILNTFLISPYINPIFL